MTEPEADRAARSPKIPVVPDPTWPLATGFWDAATRGELAFPQCRQCSRFVWYPASHCPTCQTKTLEWRAVDPRGRVDSFTVIHRAFLPGSEDNMPHPVLRVQFDAAPGVTLISALYDRRQAALLHIGAPVQMRFLPVSAEITVPLAELVA